MVENLDLHLKKILPFQGNPLYLYIGEGGSIGKVNELWVTGQIQRF